MATNKGPLLSKSESGFISIHISCSETALESTSIKIR